MQPKTITLGDQQFEVAPIPMGRLKKLVPAFNRAGRAFVAQVVDEVVFDDILAVLSAGTGKPIAELEAVAATMPQMTAAVAVVAEVAGLGAASAQSGEGQPAPLPAPATPGTPSTPG